jgi:tetratricopeptide (TPR) repeat protein
MSVLIHKFKLSHLLKRKMSFSSLLKFTTISRKFCIGFVLLTSSGCQSTKGEQLDVRFSQPVDRKALTSFTPPSDYSALSEEAQKEVEIGNQLAREGDFYRAITSFKRAIILSKTSSLLLPDLQYNIGLCYHFGKQYNLALEYFVKLEKQSPSWKPYADYLLTYYDCLLQLGEEEKAQQILQLLQKLNPARAEQISLLGYMQTGDLPLLFTSKDPSIASWAKELTKKFKSPSKAQILNACLPGAGYFYLAKKILR